VNVSVLKGVFAQKRVQRQKWLNYPFLKGFWPGYKRLPNSK